MPAVLCDVLNEEHVTLALDAITRDDALREIIATMRGATKIADAESFFAEVRAREEEHSTYMGRGVAFPHARTELVEQIILGVGRSREGVVFGAEGEPAHLLFVIAVPRRMVNDYLVCVGALARVVNDAAKRETLMNCETAAEFIELIRTASLVLE
jgi:mannitol/fructose-specific phosphotransferase system IIA component (Ntr-type)